MTEAEKSLIHLHEKNRGSLFYSDLLFTVSHHHFAPEIAGLVWEKIMCHKHAISNQLGRNIRVIVATLDYLSNITDELTLPTLMSEADVLEIANLSMRDGMTGLFNHSSCYELLELEFRSRRRYGVGVSLLLVDIDDFKSANDQHGHQEGDRVLIEIAKTLVDQSRSSDICCRIGGDEFVVILRLTNDPVEACGIAERIRARAAAITCKGRQITVSIGVALCHHATSSPRALMERADRALYRAKRDGKNRVALGGDDS
jgi:diguanylate cyclase (GGDEF)-like protein